jgi:hypothetical protein
MRNSTRRELGKARELTWHLLDGENCFFCKKPLVEKMPEIEFGLSTAPPIPVEITIHHIDEESNRKIHLAVNQSKGNRALAHRACHKAYDAKKNQIWKKRKAVLQKEAA